MPKNAVVRAAHAVLRDFEQALRQIGADPADAHAAYEAFVAGAPVNDAPWRLAWGGTGLMIEAPYALALCHVLVIRDGKSVDVPVPLAPAPGESWATDADALRATKPLVDGLLAS